MTLPSTSSSFAPLGSEPAEYFSKHPHPVLVLDATHRVRYVNTAGLQLVGDGTSTVVGDMAWDHFPALAGSELPQLSARVLHERVAASLEERWPGSGRWYAVTAHPAGPDLVLHLRDITEEKERSDERQRAEQAARIAQETARVGSFVHDLRARTAEWSDQLFRMLGLEPGEFNPNFAFGEKAFPFVHPDDRPLVKSTWKRSLITGRAESVRHRVVRRDGELRVFDSTVLAVRDQNDEADRMVGSVRDVTDEMRTDEARANLETKIQQAQKLESLGVLAGGIAHDFNNLLVGILGNASLALLDLDPDSPARHSVTEIEQAAQRAAELTRQLLAYAGKGRLVVEALDCSQVVREMTSLLRSAVAPAAHLELSLSEDIPLVEADVTQLRQVIMNLVTNASDALLERGGRIRVTTGRLDVDAAYLQQCVPASDAPAGHHVFLSVQDDGRGMDERTRARIFDPFFTTKFTGRGLGLAATLGIMRGHRGAIRVDSAPGKGTTLTLLFPAARQAEPPVAPAPAAPLAWASSGEVLVVDDEPSVRAVSRALLRRRGFTVSDAAGGREAVELLAQDVDRFRLVLLDLTMPHMDGDATFEALRALSPELKVVLMSGYNEEEVTRQFAGRGLAAFLQKPFRAEDLDNVIRRVLEET